MMKTSAYGWKPDLPDQRDFKLSLAHVALTSQLPARVDLREAKTVKGRSILPPVYDQGDLGSCHDDQTEVLTAGGWRGFSDLDGTEKLATVDPKSRRLSFERPSRIIRMPYKGKLHCAKNHTLNFRVTPDHVMLVRPWDEARRTLADEYKFVSAKDIGWYCGLMNRIVWDGDGGSETYLLRGVDHKHKPQREHREIPMVDWLRFLGIYLAEGTMLKRDQKKGCISYKIQIAASKEREKEFVRDVLGKIGVHALELRDRFTFSNRQVYEVMEELGLRGVKAGEKFVPSFVFRQSAAMISEFIAGHFAGDGCEDKYGNRAHYTSSPQLAEDLQLLIFLSGCESRISSRPSRVSVLSDGREVRGRLTEHRVSVCERKNASIERKESVRLEDYDGEVFCAEVPTHHTLVTRRSGKILISGNCTANAIAAAFEFAQRKIHEGYDFMPSRLFIYFNERAMEGTINEDSGAFIRDGMKSINAQGVCTETSWPYKIERFAKRPSKTCYASAEKHQSIKYERVPRDLTTMQTMLAAQIPFVFGFTVYESFESDQVAQTGTLGMPGMSEEAIGGHAVLAVGYDQGAFIVRNSWGDSWGQQGYFTMPYDYLLNADLSDDLWALTAIETR